MLLDSTLLSFLLRSIDNFDRWKSAFTKYWTFDQTLAALIHNLTRIWIFYLFSLQFKHLFRANLTPSVLHMHNAFRRLREAFLAEPVFPWPLQILNFGDWGRPGARPFKEGKKAPGRFVWLEFGGVFGSRLLFRRSMFLTFRVWIVKGYGFIDGRVFVDCDVNKLRR